MVCWSPVVPCKTHEQPHSMNVALVGCTYQGTWLQDRSWNKKTVSVAEDLSHRHASMSWGYQVIPETSWYWNLLVLESTGVGIYWFSMHLLNQ